LLHHNGPPFSTNSRRFYSVFVSKYASFSLTSKDILDYCEHVGVLAEGAAAAAARTTPTHVVLRECPFCPKPTGDKADNLYKLYLQIGRGAYFCHRCGASGSWLDFKAKLGNVSYESSSTHDHADSSYAVSASARATTRTGGRATAGGSRWVSARTTSFEGSGTSQGRGGGPRPPHSIPCLPMPSQRLQALYNNNLLAEDASHPGSVLRYLTVERGLEVRTLRKYGVGKASYQFADETGRYQAHDCVTFSWIMSHEDARVQEELRGAVYEMTVAAPAAAAASSSLSRRSGEELTSASSATAESAPPAAGSQSPSPTSKFVTRRIKARALSSKAHQRLDPPGGAWGFFGYHTIPADAKEVVLTEGEYDAMAVYQATGRPAISLPNGCRSLPVSALPLLERFERVYLWMDNDGPGQEGAEVFAKKIGLERCYLVRPTPLNCPGGKELPKDANEALLRKYDLNLIIETSKLTPHERILSFQDLRHDVLHEILHPEQHAGLPLPSLPSFTKIVRGLRRGELWVLTGPTGSGKTTVLTQLSLDLAEQGVNVLWGSFEIKNTRLIHKMMQQFSRQPLVNGGQHVDPDRLAALADRFGQLPLHFLKFHGGSDVDDVLDAMEYAVYVNDCQHIILDNMQFMISRQSASSSWDKFDVQDVAVEKFRKFATDRNVHITLVMHPRKQQDNSRLDISSVYGSAKATQEADLVLILQDEGSRKFLDVRKNRFNGDLGTSPLFFDRKSGRYFEEPIINVKPDPSPTANSGRSENTSFPSSRRSPPSGSFKGDRLDDDLNELNQEYRGCSYPQKPQSPALATVKIRALPKLPVPGKPVAASSPVPSGSLMDIVSSRWTR
jgi:twinkle protein